MRMLLPNTAASFPGLGRDMDARRVPMAGIRQQANMIAHRVPVTYIFI
jgi:hypothetical protein